MPKSTISKSTAQTVQTVSEDDTMVMLDKEDLHHSKGVVLQILYQDEYIVAVNKPAGMLVHRSWLDRHETQFVMQTLRDQLGRHVFPVHRLDRPTSGVLLFALDSDTARRFCELIATHNVQKQYVAVVRGALSKDGVLEAGRIDYPLKVRLDKIADKLAKTDKPPEPAITDFVCLATTEMPFVSCQRYTTSRYSLVRLLPQTGRKHQLRRHMTHIFHPIVGDTTHGDTAQNKAVLAHTNVSRLLLHAHRLQCQHPITGKMMDITAPLDEGFSRVIQCFGWANVEI